MTSDIKLIDSAVIVEGSLGIGTDTPQRALHVVTSEIHSGGSGAGFSFATRSKADDIFPDNNPGDRWMMYSDHGTARLWTSPVGVYGGDLMTISQTGMTFVTGTEAEWSFGDQSLPTQYVAYPKKGERWGWYCKDGVAHLKSGTNKMSIQPNGFVAIGIDKAERPLHVQGDEIHSSGTGAGFSFADRAAAGLVSIPQKGERWVWYASGGKARLWSGSDKVEVTPQGEMTVGTGVDGQPYTRIAPGSVIVGTGKVIASEVILNGKKSIFKTPDEVDLGASLLAAHAAIEKLTAEVAALKAKIK